MSGVEACPRQQEGWTRMCVPALAGAVLLAMLAAPAQASPADAFGLGARGSAMGGAQAAAVNDTSAGYYNPAILANLETLRIDLGYQYAKMNLRINDEDLGVDSSRGLNAGIAVPGKLGPFDIALAGTFFLPDRYFARTRALAGEQPRFQLYDNRPQRFIISANLAVSVGDKLSIGGGLTYMSGSLGTLSLQGRVGFPDAADSDLALAIDFDVKTTTYPQAGIAYQPTDWLSLGLSYRGHFQLRLQQVLDIRGDVGTEGMDPVVENGFFTVDSNARDLFQPTQFTLGAAVQVLPELLVAADLGFHRWSRFRNPATILTTELDLGTFNDQIDIPPAPTFPSPGFSDIFIPRIGVEWAAYQSDHTTAHLRSGYVYEPSPAPEQRGESNFVDNDKHTISIGGGLTFDQVTSILPLPFSLDAYAALSILPERLHVKDSPVDPVGDYQADGNVWSVGVGSRWQF